MNAAHCNLLRLATIALVAIPSASMRAQQSVRVSLSSSRASVVTLVPAALKDVSDSDAHEKTIFTTINASVRLRDGSLLVGDAGTRELRQFDRSGMFVKVWGQRGRGPGEFESISWLQVDVADTLYAYDRSQRRISQYFGGRFIRQFTLAELGTFGAVADAAGVGAGGSIVLRTVVSDQRSLGPSRTRDRLIVANASSKATRNVAEFDGNEIYTRASSSGGRMLGTAPFQRRGVAAVGRNYVALGDTETGTLRVIALGTWKELVITLQSEDGRIQESDIKAVLDTRWGSRPPNGREDFDRLQREMITATTLPLFDALHLDENDNLWILRYDRTQRGPQSWLVLSPAGAPKEAVTLPAGCEVQQVRSDQLTCTRRNSHGQVTVSTFEMQRGR